MSSKGIIAIGAAVQIILFFTPLADTKWGSFSGWDIVTSDSPFLENTGLMWFFLIIPIALLVCALMKATSMVLGMISLSGLIAVLIWITGFGDGWEFLAPIYIKLLLYIGLTIYAFVKKDMASNDGTGNTITIPSNEITIGAHTFQGNQLTSVSIPSNITTIGRAAFAENQLTIITIPDSIKTIDESAFVNNPLNSVTIGSGVELGKNAIPFGFVDFYNSTQNNKAAGTYIRPADPAGNTNWSRQ